MRLTRPMLSVLLHLSVHTPPAHRAEFKVEVLEIQRRLLEPFGGWTGLWDEGLLDSALLAAANRQHFETADVPICAAIFSLSDAAPNRRS